MFLFCGLVSKNHMLLNSPGVLIPQNADHFLPGLLPCQPESLNSGSEIAGPAERALWFEDHCSPFLPLTCHSLSPIAPSPHCQNKSFLSWINRLLILIKERDIVERAEETTLCSQLTLPIFYITQTLSFLVPFLQMDLF